MLYFFVSCFFLCVLLFSVYLLFQEQTSVEEKPMSDDKAPQIKYDVFVSFRGEIRRGFLSHLVDTFKSRKINTFIDDKLKRGEKISSSLVGAIKGSSISLIIFSPDYASSHWCLQELVTILECKEKYGRIVIPVFYQVKPTHVRNQLGSYKNAFANHGSRHKTKVQLWRRALNESADLSGIESSNHPNDAELVKAIVDLVLSRLGKFLVNSKWLVGIEEKIADVESLICQKEKKKKARLIGIWGMSGIGKTILAEQIFNKLRSKYDGCYFLANEREQSNKHGLISLKKEIFSELLANVVKIDTPNLLHEDIGWRICRMKVLIVLDDVNDSDHIEKLLGTLHYFGSGSCVIVTTTDEQVLKANKADEIYQLREFSFDKALEFFNLNAFNQSDHQREYDELSKRMVHYAKGIPLVLKVLAHRLHGKNEEVWESELDKIKKVPPTKAYDVMKLSYDDLDHKEQQIFLDLACFFLRLFKKVNVGDLKSLLKDGESDNSVVVGLERLKDKALITFSEDNIVSMHHSLQEMAWEIVRQESIEDPGSRSRLWDPDDIYEALKNEKVNVAVRSIQIYLPTIKEQTLIPHMFGKMSRLKFLEISGNDNYDCYDQLVLAAEGPQFLATELRFLCWYNYPIKSLPENFSGEKLVILKLPFGRMEKLWDGVKNLVNLKEVDLSCSKKLTELPDLSKATNLEVLLLHHCSMLTSVNPSIFSLAKLEKLDLSFCTSLTILTSDSHLCSLSYLKLGGCENLREFLVISENMEELSLEYTKVKSLPLSFGCQSKLKLLHLRGSAIEQLPSSINNLKQLLHLDVSCCRELQIIPELPLFLKTLDAKDCKSLKTVSFPSTAVEQPKENRTRDLFWNCLNLDEHSLAAIGLDAQTNVIKFANHHLSTPNHDHVENYNYQAVYVYPGSSVPEWLEYKTTKDYLIIDLPSLPPPPLRGFIFCLVLGKYPDTKWIPGLQFNITISDGESEGKMDSVRMYIDYWIGTIKSDHVCVMYDQRCSDFLNRRAKNQTWSKIQVTIYERTNEGTHDALPQEILKGFGVRPISTLA